MKSKSAISISLSLLTILLMIVYFNYSDTHSAQSKETNPTIKADNSSENYPVQSHTVSILKMSTNELYNRFGYMSTEEIDEMFSNFNESDKVVALIDGGLAHGRAEISNDEHPEMEPIIIDNETDSNAITIKELKELLKNQEEELFELDKANK